MVSNEVKNNLRRNWISIYILGLVSFFNDIASEMIYPLIPIFIKTVLGMGSAVIGIIEGVAESLNSFLKLFSGWLSDKTQKRKVLVASGYTFSNLLRPLIGIANSWGVLLGFRISDRLGKGIRSSPRDAMICDLAPENKRGFAFGFQRSMDHAGAVVGPLIASALLTLLLLDLKTVFLFSYIPGAIAVLLVIFGVKEYKKTKENSVCNNNDINAETTKTKEPKIKEPVLRFRDFKKLGKNYSYFLSIIIIFTLGNSTDAFLLLRASDLGIKTAYIPLLWAVLHLSKSLFSIAGGYLSDKTGRKSMISIGWSVYFITYIGFAFADSLWHIWALFGFYGLFFGFTEGTEKALVGDLINGEPWTCIWVL